MNNTNYKNIKEYIETFSGDTRSALEQVYKAIKSEADDAAEVISYGMPTFKLKKNLVHFAGYAKHVGFYPTPSGIEAFKNDLKEYKTSKGAIQFPLGKPMPVELIKRITKFRVEEQRKM